MGFRVKSDGNNRFFYCFLAVISVEDGEMFLEPRLAGMFTQYVDAERVKGADKRSFAHRDWAIDIGVGRKPCGNAVAHLLRRLIGESNGKNIGWRHSGMDEMADALGYSLGFARSGSRQYENRSFGCFDGPFLLRVERVHKVLAHHIIWRYNGFTSMKKRAPMAPLSHFVILGLVLSPLLVLARSQAGQILRMPESKESGNSQTMNLLEGYLNWNPAGIGGPILAIVDSTALEAGRIGGETFVEQGELGTGQISIYVVQAYDTLSEIAETHRVSTNTIIWANDLRGSTIKEGQELLIVSSACTT